MTIDTKYRIGFEAEYIHVGMMPHVWCVPLVDFSRAMKGCEVERMLMFDQPEYESDTWYLCHDSSIDDTYGSGIEIVSPPMSSAEMFRHVRRVFTYIRKYGVTDKTCGFHFTVSGENIEAINPLKLLFLMDEDRIVDYWSRGNNKYAAPHMPILESAVHTNLFYHDGFERFLQYAGHELIYKKNSTVNLEKWQKEEMLEFRIIGGPHYEHRTDKVFNTITECLVALDACINGKQDELFLQRARAFYDKHMELINPNAKFRDPRNHKTKP